MRFALLGAGLIGRFYTEALHRGRSKDRVEIVYSRSLTRASAFAEEWGIPHATDDMNQAIQHDRVDAVIVGIPNHLHEPAVLAAAEAGVPILCTKPLGRDAAEAQRMLAAVEDAGVFHAYLEDLVYPPKTRKSLRSVRDGAIGDVLWVRSREAHPGPHSAWFWNPEQSGGGAIIDMGCHCIEIARNFIGKEVRPLEVMCWADTQVHPIDAEDHAIGLVRYANGAIGQFEVSWAFRGGMDLRDEIAGTQGTIWLNHWLRTGMELFSSGGTGGYVAEKSESESGWLFPVGDEPAALGYVEMFADVLGALETGSAPAEDFYDGYVVNAIMDAAYRSVESRAWAPVVLPVWRGNADEASSRPTTSEDAGRQPIKRELLPDGRVRTIFRDRQSGEIRETLDEPQPPSET